MRSLVSFMILALPARAATQSLDGFADRGLDREIAAVERFNLTRLRDQEQLRVFIGARILIRIPNRRAGYILDDRVGYHATKNRHLYGYSRPYTVRFIRRLGAQFALRFPGRHFTVTSLVRTCAYQKRLARGNGNATTCEKSSHVTGATADIRWSDLNRAERRWMEGTLLTLERRGLIQATKENGQPVYHVMVYPHYMRYHQR